MGHFLGEVRGNRGAVSRLGSKKSGLNTTAAGWRGAVITHISRDEEAGVDTYRVYLTPWGGSGGSTRLLSEGVLDASKEV